MNDKTSLIQPEKIEQDHPAHSWKNRTSISPLVRVTCNRMIFDFSVGTRLIRNGQ